MGRMETRQLHTVGEVARLARVTVRTLHHYDRIGLLVPSGRAENGYRLYAYDDLERLRQIRLLRELRFSLDAIGRMLDAPAYDRRSALEAQRELLRERQKRTDSIIRGVDRALRAMDEEHRRHIDRWFYPCSHDMHRNLAEMYTADPRFEAYFEKRGKGLAVFVQDAIRANEARWRNRRDVSA